MGSTPPPPPSGWQPGPPPGAPLPPPPPARRTPWGLIIGIIVAVVVLLGVGVGAGFAVLGGDEDDDTTTSASDAPESPSDDASIATAEPSAEESSEAVPEATPETEATPSPTVAVDTSDVVGSWEGAYECGQGDTGLSLEISDGAADGELTAIFHFRKIPSNPDVPEGSYKMKGFLEKDGKLRLRRLEWIDRPEGFVMVGLNARITERSPQTITGTVSNVGCGVFEIDRK